MQVFVKGEDEGVISERPQNKWAQSKTALSETKSKCDRFNWKDEQVTTNVTGVP